MIPVSDCQPGKQFLFINENGVVAPCHFTDLDYGVSVMELNDAEALRRLPQLFATARNERTSNFCEDCHSTRVFDKFVA
jgi:radical SAM protein with 4Fe4S-binding SPASM domain